MKNSSSVERVLREKSCRLMWRIINAKLRQISLLCLISFIIYEQEKLNFIVSFFFLTTFSFRAINFGYVCSLSRQIKLRKGVFSCKSCENYFYLHEKLRLWSSVDGILKSNLGAFVTVNWELIKALYSLLPLKSIDCGKENILWHMIFTFRFLQNNFSTICNIFQVPWKLCLHLFLAHLMLSSVC